MPDDHSKLVPLLPTPNRTVKRLSADDSADSRVKVGHRQALIRENARLIFDLPGFSISDFSRNDFFQNRFVAGLESPDITHAQLSSRSVFYLYRTQLIERGMSAPRVVNLSM